MPSGHARYVRRRGHSILFCNEHYTKSRERLSGACASEYRDSFDTLRLRSRSRPPYMFATTAASLLLMPPPLDAWLLLRLSLAAFLLRPVAAVPSVLIDRIEVRVAVETAVPSLFNDRVDRPDRAEVGAEVRFVVALTEDDTEGRRAVARVSSSDLMRRFLAVDPAGKPAFEATEGRRVFSSLAVEALDWRRAKRVSS